MATKEIVEIVDDINGKRAAHTVPFGLDGVEYEIDLSEENRARLLEALEEFIPYARRIGGRKRTALSVNGNGVKRDKAQIGAVRDWARQNGWPDLGDRGRIPNDAQAAFDEAHKPQRAPEPAPAARKPARPRGKRTPAKADA